MARKHYWQFLVADDGTPIEGADITITEAGTDIPIYVYRSEGGVDDGTNQVPQVITSKKGYFEFWIGDDTEANGVELTTKIKLSWVAAGVTEGFIDHIDVFNTTIGPVDITDQSTDINKSISNKLAFDWETHRNFDVAALDIGDSLHGIGPVDRFDATDNTLNKLVSNQMIYDLFDLAGGGGGSGGGFVRSDATVPFTGVQQGITPTVGDAVESLVTIQYLYDIGFDPAFVSHVSNKNNPHGIRAEDIGAATEAYVNNKVVQAVGGLVSINGVNPKNANHTLLEGHSIHIVEDFSTGTITISETHSRRTDNPHSITAAQIGAAATVHGTHVPSPSGNVGKVLSATSNTEVGWISIGSGGFGTNTQDVTGSRSAGATYTNSTGGAILVAIGWNWIVDPDANGHITLEISDGSTWFPVGKDSSVSYALSDSQTAVMTVPSGWSYKVNTREGAYITKWVEVV